MLKPDISAYRGLLPRRM